MQMSKAEKNINFLDLKDGRVRLERFIADNRRKALEEEMKSEQKKQAKAEA